MRTESTNQARETLNLFQGPFHELLELNMKTLQNFSYIKFDELSNLKNPQDLFEKHVNIMIDNSHKSLDYLQKATEILEKNLILGSNKFRENAENIIRKTRKTQNEIVKETAR